ncbi:hypothetical protein WN48_04334 [Eufriesea mexicana]|nr:hypothetical protein WN48_04334 [Eufriesea mexicana]
MDREQDEWGADKAEERDRLESNEIGRRKRRIAREPRGESRKLDVGRLDVEWRRKTANGGETLLTWAIAETGVQTKKEENKGRKVREDMGYAEVFSKAPPAGIRNAVLLCEPHKGFLYSPTVNNDLYTIATAEEWSKLMQFYDVDYPIVIKKNSADFNTDPGIIVDFGVTFTALTTVRDSNLGSSDWECH